MGPSNRLDNRIEVRSRIERKGDVVAWEVFRRHFWDKMLSSTESAKTICRRPGFLSFTWHFSFLRKLAVIVNRSFASLEATRSEPEVVLDSVNIHGFRTTEYGG